MSIGAAVRSLQADFPEVTHSSLRFLEREGLLSAHRTAGGHRLYARDDISRVALIKSWQRQGASLEEVRSRLETRDELQDSEALANVFFDLVKSGQLEAAQELILQADTAGIPMETLFLDVLRPALARVGDEWFRGRFPVHQEKEISSICRELVTEITLRHAEENPSGPLILSACVAGERHEIGLSMINGMLRARGYRVRYLGPDVSTVFLVDAVRADKPDVVLLTATTRGNEASCEEAIRALQAEVIPTPPILVGGAVAARRGSAFSDLGAHPVRDDQFVERVADVLGVAADVPVVQDPPELTNV